MCTMLSLHSASGEKALCCANATGLPREEGAVLRRVLSSSRRQSRKEDSDDAVEEGSHVFELQRCC